MNLRTKLSPLRAILPAALAAIALAGPRADAASITLSNLFAFPTNELPLASLTEGSNGVFYGTTFMGGISNNGTVFSVTTSGVYHLLVSFTGANGANPAAPLFLDGNANFYGTTSAGGLNNNGTIFVVSQSGDFTNLADFTGTNGAKALGGIIRGPAGYFYGTTSAGGANGQGEIFSWSRAGGVTNLHSFSGTDGSSPRSTLVRDSVGNLYGTTFQGGANGLGAVFQLTPSNTFTTLASFSGADGAFPGSLVIGTNGELYGTTFSGGSNFFGSAFRVSTTGRLTSLVSFAVTNGSNPNASLLLGADGFLYGTTVQGGAYGLGVVFRISAAGGSVGGFSLARGGFGGGGSGGASTNTNSPAVLNLAQFQGPNGAYPQAGLAQAGDGNLYGTTSGGSTAGFGNVFELSGFAPTIFRQPATQAFVTDGNFHFVVGATGSGPLSYQWQFDNLPLTNNATISGATASNLTLQAVSLSEAGSYTVIVTNNFGAVTSSVAVLALPTPLLTIQPPPPAVANPALTFHGTATDRFGISGVQYQLNGGASLPASPSASGGFATWSAAVTLQAGTNIFKAYSMDPVGNQSRTQMVTTFYVTRTPLTLLTAGAGTIRHDFSAVDVVVGRSYTVTAAPAAGNLFSNWTGTITAAANPLTFVMQSNMVLQANFVPNIYLAAGGRYDGLFYAATNLSATSAGMLKGLFVGARGAYSATVLMGGTNYPISGAFDVAGNATNQIPRAHGLGPLTLVMNLDATLTPPQITGTVQGTSGSPWTSTLLAEKAGTALPSGEYTILIPPAPGAPANSPPGDGYALLTNHTGTITIHGALADGTVFGETVPESETHFLALYAAHTNGEVIFGWLDLDSGTPAGTVEWVRSPAAAGLFPAGFTNTISVQGSPWIAPPAQTPALNLPSGALDMEGGALPSPLVFNVSLNDKNALIKLPGSPANFLSGTIAPKTGRLQITFGNGQGASRTTGYGAALQNQNSAGGYFFGQGETGAISLHP